MITKYSYGQNVCQSAKNNVIERFKESCAAEVRADLMKNRSDMVLICENLDYNINIGSAIRANNAFLNKEVYVVGRRKIDTRSAVGMKHYENIYHADTVQEVVEKLHTEGYIVYAVDNVPEYNPQNIWDVDFPAKSAFLLGNEGDGITPESAALCDGCIYVQQYGSVRSLNVAQCAAVISYEYRRRYH